MPTMIATSPRRATVGRLMVRLAMVRRAMACRATVRRVPTRWATVGRAPALATARSGAVAAALLVCGGLAPSSALAVRSVYLRETARLRLTSRHGFTLSERGFATGTVSGTIYVRLTAVSSSRVVAQVSIYRRGGSISGHGSASYRRGSAQAVFSGSMSVDRGTGSYRGVKGSALSFDGTIARSNNAIGVQVAGRVSL